MFVEKFNIKELPDKIFVKEIADNNNLSMVVAALLIQKGITDDKAIKMFLEPDISLLHDPFLLSDMQKAVDLLRKAKEENKNIWVFGDYDVDGITSTAIIYKTLSLLDFNISWMFPDRLNDGYDISIDAINELAYKGCELLITCDCGSNANEAIDLAIQKGITVIVTDHHNITSNCVNADAIINPYKENCNYPFKNLSGAGVAFKFMLAYIMSIGLNANSYLYSMLDLLTLGTIADVVPLTDENRIFTVHGLTSIINSKKPGIKKLLKSGYINETNITSKQLSFKVIPKLNSASRMGEAIKAFELLTEKNEERAEGLFNHIEELNKERLIEEEKIYNNAIEIIENNNYIDHNIIIVYNDEWLHSICGNIASKLCKKYKRPAVVIGGKKENNYGIGSCRQYGNVDILSLISKCEDLLIRFGGHKFAAGLTINKDNIDDFRNKLNTLFLEEPSKISKDFNANINLKLDAITLELAEELAKLEPFGEGNEKPVFVSKNLNIKQSMAMGQEKKHIKLVFEKSNGDLLDGIMWGFGENIDKLSVNNNIDIAYHIETNVYNNNKRAQLMIQAIKLNN